MRSQLFVLISMAMLLATASAFAHTGAVEAKIPFRFVLGRMTLPAGTYAIDSLSAEGAVMTVESREQKLVRMLLVNTCQSTEVAQRTRLVFHRYGDQYFLAQVWVAGNVRGRELAAGAREKEIAANQPAQDVAVVATLR